MNPLDIRQLNWADFRGNPAVNVAYQDLTAVADRPVLLHDRALVPHMGDSFRTAWSGGIHIFIDPGSPTRNHSLVHELLHEILIAERYCVIGNIPKVFDPLSDILSNEMQHPEIFRRMEDVYRLDGMNDYWREWHGKMRRSVDRFKAQAGDKDWWLIYFPRVYTWCFQKVSTPYLTECAACCPILYQAVETAAKETGPTGFATEEKNRQSLELFREHWLHFCERNLPWSCYGPPPHAPIADSTIRPIIERDRAVTADNLMALLRAHGLCTS